jgi:hypothetical protein
MEIVDISDVPSRSSERLTNRGFIRFLIEGNALLYILPGLGDSLLDLA